MRRNHIKKIHFGKAALFLALGLCAGALAFDAEAAEQRQNQIYRAFKSHLNMGKTLEAAKLYVASEFGIEPDAAVEEYFTVKLLRTNENWRHEVKNRIQEALTQRDMKAAELEDFTVRENYAAFSYTEHSRQPAALAEAQETMAFTPQETAHLIADAVFADVPEIDLLQIVIRSPGSEGEFRREKFDFVKQT